MPSNRYPGFFIFFVCHPYSGIWLQWLVSVKIHLCCSMPCATKWIKCKMMIQKKKENKSTKTSNWSGWWWVKREWEKRQHTDHWHSEIYFNWNSPRMVQETHLIHTHTHITKLVSKSKPGQSNMWPKKCIQRIHLKCEKKTKKSILKSYKWWFVPAHSVAFN